MGATHIGPDNQRSIHFGGVQLPPVRAFAEVNHQNKTAVISQAYGEDPQPGPAGESTREARAVALSRWALAAKLKHGVPMSELVAHFTTLSIAEGLLLK